MSERRHQPSWRQGLGPLVPVAISWAIAATTLISFVANSDIPTDALLLDSNAYNRAPWYIGMVSSIGVLGWAVGATTAAWLAWLAKISGRVGAHQTFRGAAYLTTLLLLDDLFQLHIVASQMLGVSKAVIYLGYLGLVFWWLASNAAELLRTRWPILIAALAAFGGSVVVDQLWTEGHALLMEDTFKILGTIAWAQYHVLTCADITRSLIRSSSAQRSTPVFAQDLQTPGLPD